MTGGLTSCNYCGNTLSRDILATEYTGECPWCLSVTPPSPASDEFCRPVPMPAEAAAAPPSAKFGRYIRVELLGKGGMGEVWKAWDPDLGRWVALKFLEVKTERQLAWFKQEAHIAGTLTHPNIAAVHDVGEAQGQRYIAMQFVEGTTLEQAGPLKPRRVAALIHAAAEAVAHAHREGIVHRDLTPSNMMLTRDGHLYVMDFGLASKAGTFSPYIHQGRVAGTPAFMSPAHAMGEPAAAPDDIFTLGATMRALIGGKAPNGLRGIIDRCLEGDPASRYPNAEALGTALKGYLGRKRRLIAAAIAASLLIVGGALTGIITKIEEGRTARRLETDRKVRAEALEFTRVGERHQQRGEDVPAVAEFSKAIALHPEARTLLFRSFSYWRLENYPACLADAERAVALEPSNQAAIRTRDRVRNYLKKP